MQIYELIFAIFAHSTKKHKTIKNRNETDIVTQNIASKIVSDNFLIKVNIMNSPCFVLNKVQR